jgi:plasmid stabilization system protein ParE
MNKVKKRILDDLKLTEKQKKELEKIKKYLEKENEKARERQKERGVR